MIGSAETMPDYGDRRPLAAVIQAGRAPSRASWLAVMKRGAVAYTVDAYIDPAQVELGQGGSVDEPIAAAGVHAESLHRTNAAEAERWARLAAAAKAEARRFIP